MIIIYVIYWALLSSRTVSSGYEPLDFFAAFIVVSLDNSKSREQSFHFDVSEVSTLAFVYALLRKHISILTKLTNSLYMFRNTIASKM